MKSVYVAKNGCDNADGSFDNPFLTVERAVEVAKKEKLKNVYIREGIYSFDHTLMLKDLEDLTICAYNGEEVRFIGGKIIDTSSAYIANDERIDKNVSGKILACRLPSDINLGSIDFTFGVKVEIPAELFINQKACTLARYPKSGFIPITEVLDEGACHIDGDYSLRGGVFRYCDNRIDSWKGQEDVWLYGFFGCGYAIEYLKLGMVDVENKTIHLSKNGRFGLNARDKCRDFYAINLLSELTEPGEYYFDRKNNTLYFYPTTDNIDESEFVISTMNEPIVTLLGCKNVTISDIVIEMSRGFGVQIYSGQDNTIDNCIIRNVGQNGISFGIGESCVEPDFSDEKELVYSDRSFWEHDNSLNKRYNLLAGENNKVCNCEIYDAGTGGVLLRGGYRPTLRSGGNCVHNCKIHGCDRWIKSYKPVIRIEGVGNIVSNCEIYDAAAIGIWLYGNEHIIEYNDFHDLCRDVDDSGAFYMGRNASERGNVIRYNYFHNIISRREIKEPIKDGFGVFSVYTDDGASGNTIFGNVFYRGGNWAVANNGGSYINVSNNIFIQSQSCIWHTNNLQGYYTEQNMPQKEKLCDCHKAFFYDKLCDVINVLKPPYSEKYPELKYLFKEGGVPQNNYAENNVVYQCLNFITTWHEKDLLMINGEKLKKENESDFDMLKNSKPWYEQKGNIFSSNLDFLDDFESKDFNDINAKIQELIPEFVGIPWDKIGYKKLK